jgi:hypothetical protein
MTPLRKRCELDIILNLLNNGLSKAQIRKKLHIKASNLSNHLRRLENSGFIERQGKFLIKVLPSSHSHPMVTKNKVHISLNKRGHAFNFKIVFPREKNLIEKPKVQNELKQKILKELPFGSLKLIKNKNSIWINRGSLTIYSNNSYYSGNALHSKFRALKEIDNLANYFKDRFGFSGIYGIEVFREHYGLIFNKFAKWILGKKRKLYVKDRGNKSILWVDSSREDDIGLQEFEGNDPLRINSADEYFQSHERTGWKVTPEFMLGSINKVTQNQMIFAENMRSHIDAVQKLGNAVEKLTDKVDQLGTHTKKEDL